MKAIAALSEIIIPADSHSPGAKAAGVSQTISDILGVSLERQKTWIDGLAAIDERATLDFGKRFINCNAHQQIALVEKISSNEAHPRTLEERFFVVLKQSTVDAYYLSKVGIHDDLNYQGNAVLTEFPGCNHQEHRAKLAEGSHKPQQSGK